MRRMPETPLVFDTVTISNFLLSGAEGILIERYPGRARVTDQVLDELTSGIPLHHELSRIAELLKKKIFLPATMTPAERKTYADLVAGLGRGEASCIAVAYQRKWTMVTDDRAARGRCSEKGVRVTGTIGILKAAFIDKQLTGHKADEILQEMVRNGFYSPVGRISDLV
jgi:predicted nucleic acid-binding protein